MGRAKLNKELERLKRAYNDAQEDSFGLFLGAGINLPAEDTKRKSHKVYSWKELLQALDRRICQESGQSPGQNFERLWRNYRDDWPKLASEILGREKENDRVFDWLEEIVYGDIPRGDIYARLRKSMLDQAPTLRAALCFSAEIKKQTGENTWTFQRNRKIGTVVTSNYDFFFGAGWTRYQSFKTHWKVQTPFSGGKPDRDQRPVNYIHGYIPYNCPALVREGDLQNPSRLAIKLRDAHEPLSKYLRGLMPPEKRRLLSSYDGSRPVSGPLMKAVLKALNRAITHSRLNDIERCAGGISDGRIQPAESPPNKSVTRRLIRLLLERAYPDEIRGFRKTIVLTEETYREAYSSDASSYSSWDSYEHAQGSGKFAEYTLWKAINEYQLIFLGISFDDEPLRDMLKTSRGGKQHFAIVRAGSGEADDVRRHEKEWGVYTVEVESYSGIAGALREVYCAPLKPKTWRDAGLTGRNEYWKRLQDGPTKG